jgi:hypothetical protein
MTLQTKLRIHNITLKAALRYGSEMWVLNERDNQHLEAAQTFLSPLLGFAKLDHQRNRYCTRGKISSSNYSSGRHTWLSRKLEGWGGGQNTCRKNVEK